MEKLRKNVDPYVDVDMKDERKYEQFWTDINRYVRGGYTSDDDWVKLDAQLKELEKSGTKANRLYFMALPSTVYQQAIVPLKAHAMATT